MPSYRNLRSISLYSADHRQLPYINSDEARRLIVDGSHEWKCTRCLKVRGEGRCYFGQDHNIAVYEIECPELDDNSLKPRAESAATLTFADMKRNIGITEGFPGLPAEMRLVNRTRKRIQNWGAASLRNRAVTIIPRGSLPGKPRANLIIPLAAA